MKLTNDKEVSQYLTEVSPEHLIRLIYISRVNTSDNDVFKHIQKHSNKYNKNHNIKGFLCNNNEYFLQCLEGSKQAVLPLMAHIFKDIQHYNVAVIMVKRVRDYSFMDWRMRSLNLNDDQWRETKHLTVKEFLPFRPETWQPWFVETFLHAVKEFDNPDLYRHDTLVTYDTLGYHEVEKRLVEDSILFWLFIALVLSVSFTLFLFSYDGIPP